MLVEKVYFFLHCCIVCVCVCVCVRARVRELPITTTPCIVHFLYTLSNTLRNSVSFLSLKALHRCFHVRFPKSKRPEGFYVF